MPKPSPWTIRPRRIGSPFPPCRPQPEQELDSVRKPDYNRRVAVTGLGVISPVGNDRETAWTNLIRGRSGLAEITHFDINRYEHKAGGEVKDFEPTKWLDPKAVRRSESSMHFGVAAAKQAVADAGF